MKRTLEIKKKRIGKIRHNAFYTLYIEMFFTEVILYLGKVSKIIKDISSYVKRNYQNESLLIIKELDKYITEDPDAKYWCISFNDDLKEHRVIICCVENLNVNDIDDLATFNHELLHAAIFICNELNIHDDKHGFETLVYLHEFIFRNFLKKIKGKK